LPLESTSSTPGLPSTVTAADGLGDRDQERRPMTDGLEDRDRERRPMTDVAEDRDSKSRPLTDELQGCDPGLRPTTDGLVGSEIVGRSATDEAEDHGLSPGSCDIEARPPADELRCQSPLAPSEVEGRDFAPFGPRHRSVRTDLSVSSRSLTPNPFLRDPPAARYNRLRDAPL
jgi:hypothetical protein